jgi:hypothetical protein
MTAAGDAYSARAAEYIEALGTMESVHPDDRELITPPDEVGSILEEFARCLEPGGSLLLGFFEGQTVEPFDHAVVTAYRWSVEALGEELRSAGFEVVETRGRHDPGARSHGAIVARRLRR